MAANRQRTRSTRAASRSEVAGSGQPASSSQATAVAAPGEHSEVEQVIAGRLAFAVENFLGHGSRGRRLEHVPGADEDTARTKEERLCRALVHVADLSLRTALTEADKLLLQETINRVLPAMQTSLAAIATGQSTSKAGAASSKASVGVGFFSSALAGVELIKAQCAIACTFGVPVTLVAEEVSTEMVRCLKHLVKEVVVQTLSQRSAKESKKEASKDTAVESNTSSSIAALTQEEVAKLCNAIADALHAVHEFLCRQGLADELLHQLVHLSLGLFFLAEPHFRICAAAEELLVTIFSRYEGFRSSILQEFLVHVTKLPTGKRARPFRLPVAEDSTDHGLSTWTHLLLRLLQCSCLPLRDTLGALVEFEELLKVRASAQVSLAQLASGLIQRLLVARVRDEELRAILDELVDELVQVCFKPAWPSALALLRTIAQQLVGLTQAEKKKDAVETAIREAALKVISKVAAFLYYHHVEVKKRRIKLPSWSEPLEKVERKGRFLQHLALRSSLEDAHEMPWTPVARAVEAWDADLYLSASEESQSGLRFFTDEIVFQQLVLAHLEDERVGPARFPPGHEGFTTLASAIFPAGHSINAWTFMVCEWAEAANRARRAASAESKAKLGEGEAAGDAGAEPDDVFAREVLHETEEGMEDQGDDEIEVKMELEDGDGLAAESTVDVETQMKAVAKRFLAAAWTSQAPLRCEGATWRTGVGRRVVQASTVYVLYRQLRSAELDGLRRAMVDCFVVQANSPQASLRKTAMRCLSEIVDSDSNLLSSKAVEETIDMRLRDESSWVRHVSLDLLGRLLEETLAGPDSILATTTTSPSAEALGKSTSAKAVLLRYRGTVRGRINDTSVLVRRQASKILSAFVLAHPAHPDVVPVSLDLLRRSTDSEVLRNLVMGTFELLWFVGEEPTQSAVKQLAQVIVASRSLGAGPADILSELLERFKKNLKDRKRSKGFEHSIRRWTALLLNELVQLSGQCGRGSLEAASSGPAPVAASTHELQVQRRAVLTTLEAFAVCRPKEMLQHLRPLSVYLGIEDTASADDQAVAAKVCQIIAAVLPHAGERRGLMDHRQVQQDLQALIRNQASTGVREAMRCLCNVVIYVTGDLNQLVAHLNAAIPTVTQLCNNAERRGAVALQDRIQQMLISRQLWTLSSLLESFNIDMYIVPDADNHDHNGHRKGVPNARRIARESLKFEMSGGSVAATMADLLARFYAFGDPKLQAVLITCLGFFLRGHRHYVKERRISDMISHALESRDAGLRLKGLETLASLLAHFGHEADAETGAKNFTDSRDDAAAAAAVRSPALSAVAAPGAAAPAATATASADESRTAGEGGKASAIESAQPLAAYTEAVLGHIGLGGAASDESGSGASENDKICAEALLVLRRLHQQGLVNPMSVLPKVFALCFARTSLLTLPAGAMMKEMLEFRPTLLLNRLDEAFRESFLAVLHGGIEGDVVLLNDLQLGALGEVYADRFRKQKTTREAFLRKALREIFRLDASRFQERFKVLLEVDHLGRHKPFKKLQPVDSASRPLPMIHRLRLVYAQFIATVVSSLPFTHESEPLLVVFECNRHLSLHAGALSSIADPQKDAAGPRPTPPASVPPALEADEDMERDVVATDLFGEAVSIMAALMLKNTLRLEYSLTAEQCAQYNPKDLRQDRLKFSGATSKKSASSAATGNEGDEMTVCARLRFPLDDWKRLLAPFLEVHERPAELADFIRRTTDGDPWDTSYSRHVAALDRLEGRAPKRGAAASSTAARVRAAEQQSVIPAATPAAKRKAAAKQDTKRKRAETPEAKPAKAAAKGKAKAKAKAKRRKRTAVAAASSDEDDPDYED